MYRATAIRGTILHKSASYWVNTYRARTPQPRLSPRVSPMVRQIQTHFALQSLFRIANSMYNYCLTGNNMLLLTNYEVHTGKYSDHSLDVRTERSEVRTKDKVRIFSSMERTNWSTRDLLYSLNRY